MDMVSMFFNVISQVLMYSLIPFIWWLVTARRKENFFSWIGLKGVRGSWLAVGGCILFFFVLCVVSQVWWIPHLLPANATVQSSYAGMGWSAFPSAFLFGMIQTGLSEEILFRGFIGKRLIAKFGFAVGNVVQGLLFGALHGVMFFFVTTPLKALVITLITGFSGWLLGWMTEKGAGGSIVPGWMAHGVGNLVLSMVQAFGWL